MERVARTSRVIQYESCVLKDLAAFLFLLNRRQIKRPIRTNFSPVIRLEALDGQRIDISSRCVQQPPRERVEHRGLVFPRDLHRVWLAHDVAGQHDRVRTTGFVILGRRT